MSTKAKECINIGKNMKYIRNKRGVTVTQLGEDLNIPRGSVATYESYGSISVQRLQMFADYYGIDVDLFYTDHEQFKKSV